MGAQTGAGPGQAYSPTAYGKSIMVTREMLNDQLFGFKVSSCPHDPGWVEVGRLIELYPEAVGRIGLAWFACCAECGTLIPGAWEKDDPFAVAVKILAEAAKDG